MRARRVLARLARLLFSRAGSFSLALSPSLALLELMERWKKRREGVGEGKRQPRMKDLTPRRCPGLGCFLTEILKSHCLDIFTI
jgi:hypothetical protein